MKKRDGELSSRIQVPKQKLDEAGQHARGRGFAGFSISGMAMPLKLEMENQLDHCKNQNLDNI
uniref:Uncharacterized protein n=1 Tax=Salix viminalis TaxID=40686 RepID=A0A6N2LTQ6_SALVM